MSDSQTSDVHPAPLSPAEGTTPTTVASLPASPRDRWEPVGDRPLTQRGQGAVWRVRERDHPERGSFALKEMRWRKGPDSTAYRRFVQEISVMSALSGSHPGIVPVVAHGIPKEGDEWQPFYVMEFAEGSLERAKDLVRSLETVLRIGVQIASALEVAHDRGIIHRDIKPGNILLLGDERRPAIADFGICHLQDGERITGVDAHTVGSRAYVAPELEGGGQRQSVSPRVDIYSLGKTLYAVVAGRAPFPRESHLEPEWHLATQFDDPRFDHLHGLLSRMVATDPEARFGSMRECREALERALENVRRGHAYLPGMYGADRVALERYTRATARLHGLSGDRLADAEIELLSESVAIAGQLVEQSGAPGRDPDYDQDLRPGDDSVAASCAEHLLVPALVAVSIGNRDLLDEWWGRVRRLLLPADQRIRRDKLLADAAAGATHAMAAVAWRRHRWELLREITAAHQKHYRAFTYFKVGDGYDTKSAAWVTHLISDSALLRAVEPALVEDAEPTLWITWGLVVVRDLLETPRGEFEKLAKSDRIEPPYLGVVPDYHGWTTGLAEACLGSPRVERGVALVIGATTIDSAKRHLRDATPVLRRWISTNTRANRVSPWLGEVGEHGPWGEWVGLRRT